MARRLRPRGASEGLLRPTARPKDVLALDDMIAALVEFEANGLCLQWRNQLGGTPPAHLPRWLLMKILPSPTPQRAPTGNLRAGLA
jgi:hypothetical protein